MGYTKEILAAAKAMKKYAENRYLDYYIEEGIAGTTSITRKPVIENTQEIVNVELGDAFGVSLKAKGYTIT